MTDPPDTAPLATHPREVKPGEPGAAHHDPSLPPIGEHRAPGSHVGLLDVAEEVDTIVLDELRDEGEAQSLAAFKKLLLALATFASLVALAYAVPLPWAQPWRADEDYVPFWNLIGRELLGQGQELADEADEAARFDELARRAEDQLDGPAPERDVIELPLPDELRLPAYEPHPRDPSAEELVQKLDNPEALAPFYEALTLTDIGYAGALTRVGHWGDSVLGNDGITSAIRRNMQARFGDAGHGFHALLKYDASYKHQGVRFAELGNVRWSSCFIRKRCKDDGRYGYGGVTAWSPGGAHTRFATAEKGAVGREAAVFEIWYVERHGGGRLRVTIDGEVHFVDTAAPPDPEIERLPPDERPVEDAWARFVVPDGAHEFEVRAAGGGLVRAYGVVLERELPGVVWDGMALIGSFTKRLRDQDPEHLAAQLGHRELDLMVFTFGGNDMTRDKGDLRKTMDPYIAEYGQVVELFRAARPEAACLIMGPVDHGERVGGRVRSRPVVARMSEAQREVARTHGCAFFDTLAAMGGSGSIARWHSRGLMSADLAHPSAKGHKVIGAMVYAALIDGYVAFREAKVGELLVP